MIDFTDAMPMWAGNDIISTMTRNARQILRVNLVDWGGQRAWAEYDDFVVNSEGRKYKLMSLGTYSGDAGQYIRPIARLLRCIQTHASFL